MKASLILSLLLAVSAAGAADEAKPAGDAGGKLDPNAKLHREYQDKHARFTYLEGKIAGAEKEVLALARKKNAEKDRKIQNEIMERMVELVEERNKAAEQYNQLKTDLAYRFPSQGEALDRSYRTQQKKTVEEIEGSIGLDELLTRTKKMIDKKYAPFNPPPAVVVPAADSTQTMEDQRAGKAHKEASQTAEEEKPKRLRMER